MPPALLFAFRLMRKNPGFTAAVVLTLGLGIGANTAIFSVVYAMLLRPLPVERSDRLVAISGANPAQGAGGIPFSIPAYEELRDGAASFTSVSALAFEGLTLTGSGEPARLDAARVSPEFFETLGVRPAAGRAFRRDEGQPGAEPVVIISRSLWDRRFGADPAILGRAIVLGQVPHVVIGVAPRGFAVPREADVWVTRLSAYGGLSQDQIRNGAGFLTGIARLKPGVGLERADGEVVALNRGYRQRHPGSPDADPRGRLYCAPLQDALVSDLRPTLLIIAGAVGLVLLVACANIGGLLLARAGSRAREIAVRAAIGASRGAIVRHLMVEHLLLAAAGAVCGIIFAVWGVDLIRRFNSEDLLGFRPATVDLPVLAFCLVVSLLTGLAFGLVPAIHSSRPDLNAVLRDGGHALSGRRRHWARDLLIVAQMALAIVLLIGASLLLESFRALLRVDPGFDPRHAITMSVSLPPARYPDDPRRTALIRETLARIEAVPGVLAASASLGVPMGIGVMAPLLAEGQPSVPIAQRTLGEWKAATPRYFETMGIPILRGRAFTWADDADAPRRVIVSQSLARQAFGAADPIGKRIVYARREVSAEIVGVAGDVKNRGLAAESAFVFYTPYAQFAWPNLSITARTAGDPHAFIRAVEAQIYAADRDLPVTGVLTLDEYVSRMLYQRRRMLYLIGAFAAVALAMAAIGLYGLIAHSASQRRAEIGIRQAVGAGPSDILRLVLAEGIRLSFAGILVGFAGAAAATSAIAGMLFRVKPLDPGTYLFVGLFFLAVALAAAYIPARRAIRLDPVQTLRAR